MNLDQHFLIVSTLDTNLLEYERKKITVDTFVGYTEVIEWSNEFHNISSSFSSLLLRNGHHSALCLCVLCLCVFVRMNIFIYIHTKKYRL